MPRPKTKPPVSRRDETLAPSPALSSATRDEVLTLAEAAAYLRLTEDDVLRLVREQGLPGRVIGEDARFLKAGLQRWLDAPSGSAGAAAFWRTHFGALADDPYLEDILKETYRRRGRPEAEEP